MATPISKPVKIPQDAAPNPQQSILRMNELAVIESCTRTDEKTGSLYLEDHMLLFVLSGVYTVRFGSKIHTVGRNEMVLVHKSVAIQYEKRGEPGSDHLLVYMMVFLKDSIIREFMALAALELPAVPAAPIPVTVHPINDRLLSYLASMRPYFTEPNRIADGLVKVKLFELLFGLADLNVAFLPQLTQATQPGRKQIAEVMEENFTNPVTVQDLAYLSGRSLSSFKRDFKAVYNTSPLQWLLSRRLQKAKELLITSSFSVTEVCFSVGFENVSHFSKLFKERFGHPPSVFKKTARIIQLEPNEQLL